eukprot:12094010-Ditylum_brightwellii.AAC.1
MQSSIIQQINCSIPDKFMSLFDIYGDVTPQALQTLQDNVKEMHFDPMELVDIIVTKFASSLSKWNDEPKALTEKPINDESMNLINENATMKAELADLHHMIAVRIHGTRVVTRTRDS